MAYNCFDSLLQLDDWVLCRLYNKKNNPKEKIIQDQNHHLHDLHPTSPLDELRRSSCNNSESLDSFEDSDGEFGGNFGGDVISLNDLPHQSLTEVKGTSDQSSMETLMKKEEHDDCGNDWFDSLSLEDLQHCLEAMPPNHDFYEIPMIYNSNQQYFFN